MRLLGSVAFALFLTLSSGAEAQPWVSYLAEEDRFALMFPTEPIVEDAEWVDEFDEVHPARRYRSELNGNVYTMLAVDFAAEYENPDTNFDLLRGAVAHAATVFRQLGTVTYDGWAHTDRIDGHRLQITTPEGRRIYFLAHRVEDKLYILDADVGARTAPPGQFEYSLQLLARDGERLRYDLQGNRQRRTDDLQDALGGPDLDGPINLGQGDQLFEQ
jgi:hypothetical protein